MATSAPADISTKNSKYRSQKSGARIQEFSLLRIPTFFSNSALPQLQHSSNYLRAVAGTDSPLIIVQSQCEAPDKRAYPSNSNTPLLQIS
jgi:hypothetical protein